MPEIVSLCVNVILWLSSSLSLSRFYKFSVSLTLSMSLSVVLALDGWLLIKQQALIRAAGDQV